jgi:CRISPR-associated protein (Cas_Cas02710)
MTKILFVTVGGSFQPIVTAIQSLQPDRVIFIASDGERGSVSQVVGEGTPCEVRRGSEVIERLPNIPTQVGLGENFQPQRDVIRIQNPDDLGECYSKISEYIRHLQAETGNEIMADYTGGTKTLSAALVLAAADCGVSLYLTIAGDRENLIKVEKGEMTRKVDMGFRLEKNHQQ